MWDLKLTLDAVQKFWCNFASGSAVGVSINKAVRFVVHKQIKMIQKIYTNDRFCDVCNDK